MIWQEDDMKTLLLRVAAVSLLVTLVLATGPVSVARVQAARPLHTSPALASKVASGAQPAAPVQALGPQPAPVRTPSPADRAPLARATVRAPGLAPLAGTVPVPVPEPGR